MNELVIPKTLLDYCDIRQRVLAAIKRSYDTLEEAEVELQTIYSYGLPCDAKPRNRYEQTRKDLERTLWRIAFDKTGFMQLMDAEAKSRFFEEVEKNPPEFTEANIRSTFLSLHQDAGKMFQRGLVNVFLKLSKGHKTNTDSPFKVNERAILSGIFRDNFSGGLTVNYSRWASEKLNDIDRVIKTLDGQKHEPRSLEMAINAVVVKSSLYEDDYYQVRAYKNGNMHLKFRRVDLLDKANKLISDYYHGQALAARVS